MASGTNTTSLATLPAETLHAIIFQLDVFSRIALGQTSVRLRHVVGLSKTDFVERLLVLECIEEYGGGIPMFSGRDIYLKPSFTSPEWEGIRWACSGCLKLLPHEYFNNYSLFGLGYRKPVPGTRAAEATSSWRPSKHGIQWGRKAWQRKKREQLSSIPKEENEDENSYPEDLFSYLENLRASGVEDLEDLVDEREENPESEHKRLRLIFDSRIRPIELDRWGHKRWLRKCNECRYQAGQPGWKKCTFTAPIKLPIQISRHLLFGSSFFRHFPGFLETL